jgi:uncharacterized protein (TIGR02271 family)
MTTSNIIVGVFAQKEQAEQALRALEQAGFTKEQLGLAAPTEQPVDLLNAFRNLQVPLEQANYYAQECKQGRTIVSVRPDGREQEARAILQHYGASDYDQRVSSMQEGSPAPPVNDQETTSDQALEEGRDASQQQRSLRLREEQLAVKKERVQTGEVEIHKKVVTEQKVIEVPVSHEEIVVERHPVSGKQASATPIGEGETIRVPLREEKVTINKETVTTGEVVIGKQSILENQRVTETTRREEPRVEHQGEVFDLTIHNVNPDSSTAPPP